MAYPIHESTKTESAAPEQEELADVHHLEFDSGGHNKNTLKIVGAAVAAAALAVGAWAGFIRDSGGKDNESARQAVPLEEVADIPSPEDYIPADVLERYPYKYWPKAGDDMSSVVSDLLRMRHVALCNKDPGLLRYYYASEANTRYIADLDFIANGENQRIGCGPDDSIGGPVKVIEQASTSATVQFLYVDPAGKMYEMIDELSLHPNYQSWQVVSSKEVDEEPVG